jgi:hypothetical protein
MRQIIKFIIFTLFVGLLSPHSFARKPAVEPVSGISIDHYDDVAPSKAKPYDFNQKKTKKLGAAKKTKEVKKTTLKEMKTKKSRTNQVIVILMVFLLPVAVWLGLMKGIKDLDTEALDNVVDLNSKRTENDDDDIDFPKAS